MPAYQEGERVEVMAVNVSVINRSIRRGMRDEISDDVGQQDSRYVIEAVKLMNGSYFPREYFRLIDLCQLCVHRAIGMSVS